jgi:hypothetical protein
MVAAICIICLAASILSILLLLLGLFRPVWVLWFLDRSNRLKVIQFYGTSTLLFAVLYFFLKMLG